jgi:hypothetical protein
MTQNKNLIYVALGLGAGVFAYYYFCRRKYKINGNGEIVANGDVESSNVDPSNPTGRELAPPPISKPITFIKEIVSPIINSTGTGTTSTNTTSTTPVTASVDKPSTMPVTMPVATPVTTSVDKPVTTPVTTSVTTPVTTSVTTSVDRPITTPVDKPALTKEVLTKEIEIVPTRTISDVKTSEPMKVGFDGMGQLCFEVGDCLYDL